MSRGSRPIRASVEASPAIARGALGNVLWPEDQVDALRELAAGGALVAFEMREGDPETGPEGFEALPELGVREGLELAQEFTRLAEALLEDHNTGRELGALGLELELVGEEALVDHLAGRSEEAPDSISADAFAAGDLDGAQAMNESVGEGVQDVKVLGRPAAEGVAAGAHGADQGGLEVEGVEAFCAGGGESVSSDFAQGLGVDPAQLVHHAAGDEGLEEGAEAAAVAVEALGQALLDLDQDLLGEVLAAVRVEDAPVAQGQQATQGRVVAGDLVPGGVARYEEG